MIYQIDDHGFEEMAALFAVLSSTGNAEKFYTEYFGAVPLHADMFFPGLTTKVAALFATRIANKLIAFHKKSVTSAKPLKPVREITDVETCGLHYLGGYIFHKVHKKFKYSKERAHQEVCQSLAILEAAKSANDSSRSEKLTACLDRGGLWKINATAQRVLVETEKIFKRNVSCQSCVSMIDKGAILIQALRNVDVQSHFAILCESSACKVDNTIAKDLLTCLLKLFIPRGGGGGGVTPVLVGTGLCHFLGYLFHQKLRIYEYPF